MDGEAQYGVPACLLPADQGISHLVDFFAFLFSSFSSSRSSSRLSWTQLNQLPISATESDRFFSSTLESSRDRSSFVVRPRHVLVPAFQAPRAAPQTPPCKTRTQVIHLFCFAAADVFAELRDGLGGRGLPEWGSNNLPFFQTAWETECGHVA